MTMVKVIKFEIADFQNGTIAEFVVENNAENWEKIAGSRYTRGIQFDKMLDFQFEKEETVPAGFISPEIWLTIANSLENTEELTEESPVIEEAAPEITVTEDTITPVAQSEKVGHSYLVFECVGKVLKTLDTATSRRKAQQMVSKLRMDNPERRYKWEKRDIVLTVMN
jgi:hypothetical protein